MPNNAIEGLAPATLWSRFFEISQVPRPSKHEERIRLYLRNFAGKNNLEIKEDETGNIVIKVPPKPGFENSPTVILQSHVDMVCEKNKDKNHDFNNDPIVLVKDGNWIKADGTTLGADNGIGAAAALAIATDYTFNHGPLELLFTVDEETGLTGANHLAKGFVEGKYLLNLDTEEDGCFYVGCSGGMDSVGTMKLEYEPANESFTPYLLFVSGLKGGHSGININDRRANAIRIIAQLLVRMNNFNYQLQSITGGSKRNAIPREAEAALFIDSADEAKLRELINEFTLETVLEFNETDPGIKITFEKKDSAPGQQVYTKNFSTKIINTLLALPHGVISMSPAITGLVETSTNLATVTTENNFLRIGTSQRSSIESAKKNIAASVKSVFDLAGAEVTVGDGYPGWQPNLESNILKISKNTFKNIFGREPELKAVHAGLECGILGDKYPGLEMISFGPTIEGAHSPDERVNIHDVEKFYRLLKAIITALSKVK
ncbi:MAG: aminoacyl-histidine dipeptidase [Bacteroidota bacterium]